MEPPDLGCRRTGAGVDPNGFFDIRARSRRSVGSVYDTSGRMLAQAVTGTPGHVNAMADAMAHFFRRIGREKICEGDIYNTNDPWEGIGHLHDITMVTPSFLRGKHVGFFACTAHVVDTGGRGFGADAASIYKEGLYIPIMKFADRGTVDEILLRIARQCP